MGHPAAVAVRAGVRVERLACRRWWVLLPVIGLSALVVGSAAIRLAKPTGWLGSDDAAYYSAAEHVLTGTPILRVHHHYSRLAVILPVAASVAVFGHSPTAVWLPMLLASLACVVLVAVLGRRLWGWREGLLAAAIVSPLPYFRILSTTAFPDVHACLWTTAAMLLAFLACRGTSGEGGVGSGEHRMRTKHSTLPLPHAALLLCGFSVGLAISAKLFAAPVAVAVACLVLFGGRQPVRRRVTGLAFVAAGGMALLLLEGLFYRYTAGDFFFTLHAHAQAAGLDAPAASGEKLGLAGLAWDRLTMPFDPTTSGWGTLGQLFWPVMLAGLVSPKPRAMAIWGLATYLGVAFMPVGFEDGIKLNPVFHGRHILPACIPFALCLAWAVGCASDAIGRFAASPGMSRLSLTRLWRPFVPSSRDDSAGVERLVGARPVWCVCLAGILLAAYLDRHQLNGFGDRDTRRLGLGISEIVAVTDWHAEAPIFVPPSIYWRYRILFPPELRARLRVAAHDGAPDWWRRVCPDIAERALALPPPGNSYLLATPRQLAGGTETWDYDVGLPSQELGPWRACPPLATVVRDSGSAVHLMQPPAPSPRAIVSLLGPPLRVAGVGGGA